MFYNSDTKKISDVELGEAGGSVGAPAVHTDNIVANPAAGFTNRDF